MASASAGVIPAYGGYGYGSLGHGVAVAAPALTYASHAAPVVSYAAHAAPAVAVAAHAPLATSYANTYKVDKNETKI